VLDALAFHQEDHVFGDVGGEVGHALEVAAHQDQLHGGPDRMGVLRHVGEQDAEGGPVQRVHLIVPPADVAAERRVAAHEGVDRVGEHAARQAAHLDDLGLGRDRPLAEELLCAPGDVGRVVAHALEVVRDLERREDQTKIARHRLV
jgi:hypothetical protein